MRSFVDSEENQTDEDREYHEEYGDNYTEGATSHPNLIAPSTHGKYRTIIALLYCYNHTMLRLAW